MQVNWFLSAINYYRKIYNRRPLFDKNSDFFMCGICGLSYDDKKAVKEMCKALAHRGPDAEGTYNNKKITLGHRRLSVIDLNARSNQPFVYSHGNKEVIIVHNGEIYNFFSIKKALEKNGYRFKTTSDTEVICAAYLEYGERCVNFFDGMFAFAIYDGDKIFFARDFAGEKPFYYFYNGNDFGFASELKALIKVKNDLTIDQQALDYYLSFNFIPAPYTIYKEIKKLPAAHYGFFDLRKKSLKIKSYRYFPTYSPEQNIEKKVEKAIERSVRSRLVSDVPVGIILSAGLDSTTVAYFASREIENLTAYSVEFEINDESLIAKKLSDELEINFVKVPFNKDDFYKYRDIVFKQHDEPFGDHSAFPTTKVSQFARKDMTVALSGDGGDEIFGGYEFYQKAYLVEWIKKVHNPILKMILNVLSPFSKNIKELNEIIDQPFQNSKSFSEELYRYMTPEAKAISRKKMDELLAIYPFVEALTKYDYTFNNLPDHFLVKTDRATMNYALELRSPMLSKELWELSTKIPVSKKVFPQTKNILREVMKNKLPGYILKRKKQGFGAPIIEYMIEDKDIIVDIFERLKNREEVKKHSKLLSYVIDKTRKGEKILNSMQYRVYALEMWFEYWWDNRVV